MGRGAGCERRASAAGEGGAPAQRRGGPPQATHCLTCNYSVGLANLESSVLVVLVTVNCSDLLRCRFYYTIVDLNARGSKDNADYTK